MTDEEARLAIEDVEERIGAAERDRTDIQMQCPHNNTKIKYEVQAGDREGLSGQDVERCLACGGDVQWIAELKMVGK